MAFSIGKLTILVGAGILGSVLAKEGTMPSVSDVLSGAYKIALKPLKQSDSASSTTKHKNDALVAQVNSLRQELQYLANNRAVTIVTSGGSGGRRYGAIILVAVVGYGYIWWKGWKLPDLTFATKRSLSDACTTIAKRLEQVYSSISATKRDISSRIDRTDCSLNELSEENSSTKHEVGLLRGELETFDVNIQSVREVVETLESRFHRMQGNEDAINTKVMRLVGVARSVEQRRAPDALQGTPKPALEPPQASPSPRTVSLPPRLTLEPISPSTNGSNETQHQPSSATFASGLKDMYGLSSQPTTSTSSPKISNPTANPNTPSEAPSASGAGGFFSRNIISGNIPFISRTRSATQSFK